MVMSAPDLDVDDGAYLRGTVAGPLRDALATLSWMQPADPVQYLAHSLQGWAADQRRRQEAAAAAVTTAAAARVAQQAAVEEAERTCSRIKAKELALEQLVGDGGTPFEMLQAAVDVVRRFTAADACYLALIERPASVPLRLTAAAAPPPPPDTDPDEPAPPVVNGHCYAGLEFRFVRADQPSAFLLRTRLSRPTPTEAEPPGVSFSLLDTPARVVEVEQLLGAEHVRFLRDGFPRAGSYFAAAVELPSSRRRVGMLCVDTMRQAGGGGSGAALSDHDKEVVSETAAAVGLALEEADSIRRRAASNFDVHEKLRLAERFVCDGDKIYKAMFAPPPPLAKVASKGGKAAPAKAPASKESKAALEPAPIDAPLTQEQKLLHVAQLRLEAANKALLDLRTFVLAEVAAFYYPSADAQRVCVAALALAGTPAAPDADWEQVQALFGLSAIEQMRLVDATAAPEEALWALVRGALHEVDEEAMEADARSVLLLLKWVQAVRNVSEAARAAVASTPVESAA